MTRLYSYLFVFAFSLLFASCINVSMKNADGTTMSGSLMNGSMSYSSGSACTPAVPSPTVAPPPITLAPMTVRTVCEGSSCVHVMMQSDAAPQCYTQVASVRGVDFSTYAAWALGSAFAAWALFK